MTGTTLGYAFLGGILPSLIWLYFLLKEDATHPEPKRLIALAFIAGMAAVPLALPFEQWSCFALNPGARCVLPNHSTLIAWSVIEEVLKYAMAAIFILWRSAVDEAPDYVIYLLTVALGFAAAENMLYLLAPFAKGQIAAAVSTDHIRFLGSTLVHVVSSSAIGFALAFSHESSAFVREWAAALGLILAIALHTAFNTLIISPGASGTWAAFSLVWTVAVIFFAAFEVVKYFQYGKFPKPLTKS